MGDEPWEGHGWGPVPSGRPGSGGAPPRTGGCLRSAALSEPLTRVYRMWFEQSVLLTLIETPRATCPGGPSAPNKWFHVEMLAVEMSLGPASQAVDFTVQEKARQKGIWQENRGA